MTQPNIDQMADGSGTEAAPFNTGSNPSVAYASETAAAACSPVGSAAIAVRGVAPEQHQVLATSSEGNSPVGAQNAAAAMGPAKCLGKAALKTLVSRSEHAVRV